MGRKWQPKDRGLGEIQTGWWQLELARKDVQERHCAGRIDTAQGPRTGNGGDQSEMILTFKWGGQEDSVAETEDVREIAFWRKLHKLSIRT